MICSSICKSRNVGRSPFPQCRLFPVEILVFVTHCSCKTSQICLCLCFLVFYTACSRNQRAHSTMHIWLQTTVCHRHWLQVSAAARKAVQETRPWGVFDARGLTQAATKQGLNLFVHSDSTHFRAAMYEAWNELLLNMLCQPDGNFVTEPCS